MTEKLRPSMRNGSMPQTPCGPFVILIGAREIVEEDADDLAEPQGDDREVVAAQLQRRRAEQHAEQRGDCGPDRQDHPEGKVQSEVRAGEKGIGIRPHRIERDVTEVEQAGEADHDVQPQRQHHVEERQVGDAHPGGPDFAHRKRQHEKRGCDDRQRRPRRSRFPARRDRHARSPTRSPSIPEGRNTSTRISTTKAKTSW